ncbi:hypothetical protein HMPREF0043_01818 [Actinobaculum sp. oral taxon 183 str. F0552]|nr:hypothetical protein HMPREF0043_01818 [Actinobaculum sp. oral taxon 183 str. F0552]
MGPFSLKRSTQTTPKDFGHSPGHWPERANSGFHSRKPGL